MNLNTMIAAVALIAAGLSAYFTWKSDWQIQLNELDGRISIVETNTRDHPHESLDTAIRECRICFKETEGSSQCQQTRESCSAWSGRTNATSLEVADWTKPFRDDTDRRAGGCTYQWIVQCR